MTQIVKMKGMNKYFGKLHVLKDIDLTVEKGEVVVIIGASGSGKSTLGRAVLNLLPAGGRVVFQGQQISGRDRAAMRALRSSSNFSYSTVLSGMEIEEPSRRLIQMRSATRI